MADTEFGHLAEGTDNGEVRHGQTEAMQGGPLGGLVRGGGERTPPRPDDVARTLEPRHRLGRDLLVVEGDDVTSGREAAQGSFVGRVGDGDVVGVADGRVVPWAGEDGRVHAEP